MKFKDIELGTVVLIGWEDSLGCPQGWQTYDEARSTTFCTVSSAGWVVAKSRSAVQIAGHFAMAGGKAQCLMGHAVIPRSAIREIHLLHDPR